MDAQNHRIECLGAHFMMNKESALAEAPHGFSRLVADFPGLEASDLPDLMNEDSIEAWSSLIGAQVAMAIQVELGVEPTAEMLETGMLDELLDLLEFGRLLH